MAGSQDQCLLLSLSLTFKTKMISSRRIAGAYLAVLVALIYGVISGERRRFLTKWSRVLEIPAISDYILSEKTCFVTH